MGDQLVKTRKSKKKEPINLKDFAQNKWVGIKEASALLDVHEDTVRRWCADGDLVAQKIGRHWRIRV